MVMTIVAAAVAARTFLLRGFLLLPVAVTLVAVLATAVAAAASLLFSLGLVHAVIAVLMLSGVLAVMLMLVGFVVTVAG